MSHVRRSIATVVAAMALAVGAGCSDIDEAKTPPSTAVPEASREDVVAALTTDVIAPAYATLVDTTSDLGVALDALCSAAHVASARAEAQMAWRRTQDAWMQTRAFRFGPAMELRSMSKIDFPIDPSKIRTLLGGSEPIDAASVLALGADQRGLGGVEDVLFDDERAIDERACSYLVAATEGVLAATIRLADAWATDPPTDTKQFVDDSVNGMIFALVDVADQQLGRASGDVTGTQEFAEVDSGNAHGALADMASILASVVALVEGDGGLGLANLVVVQSDDSGVRLLGELAAAQAAVGALAAPLADTTDAAPVAAACETVRVPLRTLRTETASLLGVTLKLGDADGDS